MKKLKQVLWVAGAVLVLLVVGYFIYTGHAL